MATGSRRTTVAIMISALYARCAPCVSLAMPWQGCARRCQSPVLPGRTGSSFPQAAIDASESVLPRAGAQRYGEARAGPSAGPGHGRFHDERDRSTNG
jgi:hypothetical protein